MLQCQYGIQMLETEWKGFPFGTKATAAGMLIISIINSVGGLCNLASFVSIQVV